MVHACMNPGVILYLSRSKFHLGEQYAINRRKNDEYGREYYLVEKQKPDQQRKLFSTDKEKRTVKGFWIDILLMWLVRLIANLIPINIWGEG